MAVDPPPPGVWSLLRKARAHIGSLLSSVALAAMIAEIAGLGWRGAIAFVVDQWDRLVRPLAKSASELLVTRPLEWAFSWHFELPLLLRDYLTVGLLYALSSYRFGALYLDTVGSRVERVLVWFGYLLFWPILLCVNILEIVDGLRTTPRREADGLRQAEHTARKARELSALVRGVDIRDVPPVKPITDDYATAGENLAWYKRHVTSPQRILATTPIIYFALLLLANLGLLLLGIQ